MQLTPSMAALAAMPHLTHRSYSARRSADGWVAKVTAGVDDGPCPCWVGNGPTKEAALEVAASHALGYWRVG